ncbi:hypothetical protein HPP92_009047 [Vanilla planifolia]|uniref:Uncharacterized protein n=1 Tax=Vanilla planifolia TaxID=51239 RepID=A0A835V690_VANPL|nr:hypothetical protein HPP92_009293 [Vanilla planifolia]KAG0486952.1 hypothetical protein HPP92_009047 [Vanilla planifolia]
MWNLCVLCQWKLTSVRVRQVDIVVSIHSLLSKTWHKKVQWYLEYEATVHAGIIKYNHVLCLKAYRITMENKNHAIRQPNLKLICERLASEGACNELISNEKLKNQATFELDSLFDEIRPAIEEYEKDSQDNVSTTVAEKWIEASCNKLKAEFNLYASIIKNISCTPRRPRTEANPQGRVIEIYGQEASGKITLALHFN